MLPLAERLAAYAAALRFEDLGSSTIERAKLHIADTLGCGIAAFDEAPVRACRDLAQAIGTGACTIIGTTRRTTADLAAFANGAAFRFHDLNDVYVGRPSGHPSDNIAACLAVAEAEHASGAELITAIVLAYEINCRLIDVFDMTTRGWDAPTFSLPAVALAAGKLMKLPQGMLTQAVNLAINDHISMGQTRSGTLSDWKGLADAEASRNAVFATMLARAGITGPAPIFEGKKGLFQLVTGPAEVDVGAFGKPSFRIHQCGIKAYPVVVYGQTAVLASVALAKEVGNLDRISTVEVATTRRGHQQAGSEPEKWTPQTRGTADHSLPYIVARAMSDGDISNDSYAPEKLKDPRILAFMRKISVVADPTLDSLRGSVPATRISITLDDGRRLTRQIEKMPGFDGEPVTRADVEHKFRGNVGKRLSQPQTKAVLEDLWMLEEANGLGRLLEMLALQADP